MALKTAKQYWKALAKSGWLEHVPKDDHERMRAHIEELFESNDPFVYTALCTGGYDGEMIENNGDYSRLVAAYRDASSGVFDPTDVTDSLDYDTRQATIGFTFRGTRFERQIPFESDYVDPAFDDFVNEALASANVRQRFIQMPTDDQCAALTFMDPEVYDRACDLGLIPDQDELMDGGGTGVVEPPLNLGEVQKQAEEEARRRDPTPRPFEWRASKGARVSMELPPEFRPTWSDTPTYVFLSNGYVRLAIEEITPGWASRFDVATYHKTRTSDDGVRLDREGTMGSNGTLWREVLLRDHGLTISINFVPAEDADTVDQIFRSIQVSAGDAVD
jgi:hypothetical protein